MNSELLLLMPPPPSTFWLLFIGCSSSFDADQRLMAPCVAGRQRASGGDT